MCFISVLNAALIFAFLRTGTVYTHKAIPMLYFVVVILLTRRIMSVLKKGFSSPRRADPSARGNTEPHSEWSYDSAQ